MRDPNSLTSPRSIDANAQPRHSPSQGHPPPGASQGPSYCSEVARINDAHCPVIFPAFRFTVSLRGDFDAMPIKARFRLPSGAIEVAPRFGLRAAIPGALRRHGAMTSLQLANWLYWERTPRNHRLSAKWWANSSQQSATRRAIARLKRDGAIRIAGRSGRRFIYAIDRQEVR